MQKPFHKGRVLKTRKKFQAVLICTLFMLLGLAWLPAHATGSVPLPSLVDFVSDMMDGQSGVIRGVYVPGVLANRVIRQTADSPDYVAPLEGFITQFSLAERYRTIGLLAHNHLSGQYFFNLRAGQEVMIVNGDGRIMHYTIAAIASYQALDPAGTAGNFINIATGVKYSAADIFSMYYQKGDQVTFQTCIEADGNSSWGRLFVTALPGVPVRNIILIQGLQLFTFIK
jgi:hypothetical protein